MPSMMWSSRRALQQIKLTVGGRYFGTQPYPMDIRSPNMKVAFVGVGQMGQFMARNVAQNIKGTVTVFDSSEEARARAVKNGCEVVVDAAKIGYLGPDVIFTSLPTTKQGLELARTLLETESLKPDSVWVDFTSGVPDEAIQIHDLMAEAGVRYLDAGVAGGPGGADQAKLSMMIGGCEETLTRMQPLLRLMSAPGKVTLLGPVGCGHAVKSINNALLAANVISVGEALSVLVKRGIPVERALAAINTSSGRSLVSSERYPKHVINRKFDFGFSMHLMKKDTDIARGLLDEANMTAPALRWANTTYIRAMKKYGPTEEHMKVCGFSEEEAGCEVKETEGETTPCDPILDPPRCFNFSAGPACLPTDVLKKVQQNFVSHNDSGMSFIEMSHRDAGGPVQNCISDATSLLREMMQVPDNYHILFFHGGAHGQFAGIPMNLAYESKKVDIIDMGVWTQKAMTEAVKMADVHIPYKCTTTMNDPSTWEYRKDAAYIHVCMNETISGLEILKDFDMPEDAPPLVADATSTLLSRPMDISKYGVVYASAGKNFGPAGVTIVIVREDLAARTPNPMTPGILSLNEAIKPQPIHSLYNTPPVFQIHTTHEILKWMKKRGGVEGMEQQAIRRSSRMYEIIDNSGGFYTNSIDHKFRSRMNICFNIKGGTSPEAVELENKFVAEAEDAGMIQLFKHPAFGGLRITSYNGLEEAAVDAVCKYLADFYNKYK